MPLSHSANTYLPLRVWFEESFASSWKTNHRLSPSSPAHFILFLSSSASDCLSLEGWQRYINLPDLSEGRGLPTWLSKDLVCICRFLEMLTKKNSDRKASSLMVAFSCLTINLHIGKHVVSFTSKIVPHPDIRTFFTLKMGTVHNGTYFHSLSLLSVMSTSFSLFSLSLSFECNLPPPAF